MSQPRRRRPTKKSPARPAPTDAAAATTDQPRGRLPRLRAWLDRSKRLYRSLQPWLKASLGVDLRSLALLRIGLGLMLLADLINRAPDIHAHYSDWGVLSRPMLHYAFGDQALRSLHYLSGHSWFQALLFVVAGLCAIGLSVGWKTRAMTIASWLLLASLHNRNPQVLQAGDALLRMLLFWSMFVPLGARWSLDRVRRGRGGWPADHQWLSLGGAALLLQVCMMYWFTAALKTDPSWWNGRAVWYALQIDLYATPLGVWLRDYTWLTSTLTHATIWLEICGPIVVLSPWATGPLRLAMIASFWGLHLGIAATMSIGLFPYICLIAWLPFIPRGLWDRLHARLSRATGSRRPSEAGPEPAATGSPSAGPWRRYGWWAGQIFCGGCLLYVLAWNVRTLDFAFWSRFFPPSANGLAHWLRLDQRWNMFAPGPMLNDGWYIVEGLTVGGDRIDLWRDGRPVVAEKPVLPSAEFTSQRWQKYMMNLRSKRQEGHRLLYLHYMCQQWNQQHVGDDQVVELQLVYMQERTGDGFIHEVERLVLFEHVCL